MRRFLRKIFPGESDTSPHYQSYEEAEQSAGSYQQEAIVEIVVEKTKNRIIENNWGQKFQKNDDVHHVCFEHLIMDRVTSTLRSSEPIKVIDIGGAAGYHFFSFKNTFDVGVKSWKVIETPLMASRAQEEIKVEPLTFIDQKTWPKKDDLGVDLILASGVLQYLENPLDSLHSWLNLKSEAIFIDRTLCLINEQKTIYTIQKSQLFDHGPGPIGEKNDINNRELSFVTVLVPIDKIIRLLNDYYENIYVFNTGNHVRNIDHASYDIGSFSLFASNSLIMK